MPLQSKQSLPDITTLDASCTPGVKEHKHTRESTPARSSAPSSDNVLRSDFASGSPGVATEKLSIVADSLPSEAHIEHGCLALTASAFDDLVKTIPIVRAYAKTWDTTWCTLPSICGVSSEQIICCANVGPGNTSDHRLSRPRSCSSEPSPFLVPCGLPYTVIERENLGVVYCTPFYSVIPDCIPEIPKIFFSLSRITLDRVISNPVFRHELVFNPKLQIEPPPALARISSTTVLWHLLEIEIEELMASSIVRGPITMLTQFFYGMRAIMMSVLPAELSPQVEFYFSPSRLLEPENMDSGSYLADLVSFTLAVLDACVIPLRKKWLAKVRAFFSAASEDATQLISGFKIVLSLLNLAKLDIINANIKDRVALLIPTTLVIEESYYRALVATHKLQPDSFSSWLHDQPTVLAVCTMCSASDAYASPALSTERQYLSQLVGGFVWSQLRRNVRKQIPSIFALDFTRIQSIQRRFDAHVLSVLEEELLRATTNGGVPSACGDFNEATLPHSAPYCIVEARLIKSIVQEVYMHMLHFAGGNDITCCDPSKWDGGGIHALDPAFTASTLSVASDSWPEALVNEIITLLALHWWATRSFYLMAG